MPDFFCVAVRRPEGPLGKMCFGAGDAAALGVLDVELLLVQRLWWPELSIPLALVQGRRDSLLNTDFLNSLAAHVVGRSA